MRKIFATMNNYDADEKLVFQKEKKSCAIRTSTWTEVNSKHMHLPNTSRLHWPYTGGLLVCKHTRTEIRNCNYDWNRDWVLRKKDYNFQISGRHETAFQTQLVLYLPAVTTFLCADYKFFRPKFHRYLTKQFMTVHPDHTDILTKMEKDERNKEGFKAIFRQSSKVICTWRTTESNRPCKIYK